MSSRSGHFDDAERLLGSDRPTLSDEHNSGLLIMSWPQCPPARLEQAVELTSPPSWMPATNAVSISGGRKTVTIAPALNSAFFRLALD